jgi:hypothetical protein
VRALNATTPGMNPTFAAITACFGSRPRHCWAMSGWICTGESIVTSAHGLSPAANTGARFRASAIAAATSARYPRSLPAPSASSSLTCRGCSAAIRSRSGVSTSNAAERRAALSSATASFSHFAVYRRFASASRGQGALSPRSLSTPTAATQSRSSTSASGASSS